MPATMPEPYSVQAHNSAKDSENKIHDDEVARRFGFSGGLVPGVDVYAYMTHQPLAHWGRAFLDRGWIECRFLKPVYDGTAALVMAEPGVDGGLTLRVESGGETCATGLARFPESAPEPLPPEAFRAVPPRPTRPPADAASLKPEDWLGIRPFTLTVELVTRYAADVRETAPVYPAEGIAHPGLLLRTCNWTLGQNVVLGPWIHVGSTVQHLGIGRIGDTITACARIIRNYEHKGHGFVELDALVFAQPQRPLARVAHTAIYRPRQVAGAAV